MNETITTAPGWYTDPNQQNQLRWWTGAGWTEHTMPQAPVAPSAPRPRPRTGKRVAGIILTVLGAFNTPFALLALFAYAYDGEFAYGLGRTIVPLAMLIVGIVLWSTSGPRPVPQQQFG